MSFLIVGILLLLALLGLPLFVVLGSGGIYASINAGLDPEILIIELYRLATEPNLVAIPLFTFAGMIMAAGGSPQRLVKLFNAMFGWMPGGLAVVTIISCAFFTAFSGASGVTIIALGGLLYPMLKQAHYQERFSLGLLTSSGSLGLLFPPSIAILLYGIVSGVNIDDLFLAGIVPGLLLLFILSVYSLRVAKKSKVPKYTFSFSEMLCVVRGSIWDIMLPLVIITGIFGGYVTVTEAAALTAAY
ncbi:MAG: TRAP transporter large permease subunit, partial [Gammaproteobacteria bacterium]|nr:TRAP transporter large permease subunit [Gammaproteobacteria bacterium]